MKLAVKIVFSLSFVIFLTFCSKEHDERQKFEVIKANTPSEPNFKIKLKEFGVIKPPEGLITRKSANSICFDGKDKIYILNKENREILKYSLSGSRFRFSNDDLKNIADNIDFELLTYTNSDELILFNGAVKKFYIFTPDGKLKSVEDKLEDYVQDFKESKDYYYIKTEKSTVIEMAECSIQYMVRMDKNFNPLDTISISNMSESASLNSIILLRNAYLPLENNELYLPFGSRKFYRIHHLNSDLSLKSIITKKFTPITRIQEEKDFIFKVFFGTLSIEDKINYKGAIKRQPYVDHKERIWVFPSIDRKIHNNQGTYADIYTNNDEFINRIYLPEIWRYNPFFIKKDKFFVLNYTAGTLDVYSIAN